MKNCFILLAAICILTLLLSAGFAAELQDDTQQSIRCSIDYQDKNDAEATLVFTNSSNQNETVNLIINPVSDVKQINGVAMPRKAKFWGPTEFDVLAKGFTRYTFLPGAAYELVLGQAYFLTVNYGIQKKYFFYTFPYIVPTKLPVFISEWSKEVNGLQARLRCETENVGRIAVYVELLNCSIRPISITNQPTVTAEVKGSVDGKQIQANSLPMGGPIPYSQTAVIPRDSTLTIRIDQTTVGIPADSTLLAVHGKHWELGSGAYKLNTILEVTTDDAWKGKIEIPSLDIVVGKR